jgi:hypothetical protein
LSDEGEDAELDDTASGLGEPVARAAAVLHLCAVYHKVPCHTQYWAALSPYP